MYKPNTFWSGDNLIDIIGPWSSVRNVEHFKSVKPRTRMPVAPPDRTLNTCTREENEIHILVRKAWFEYEGSVNRPEGLYLSLCIQVD